MKSKAHEPTRQYWNRLIRQHASGGKDRSKSRLRKKMKKRNKSEKGEKNMERQEILHKAIAEIETQAARGVAARTEPRQAAGISVFPHDDKNVMSGDDYAKGKMA